MSSLPSSKHSLALLTSPCFPPYPLFRNTILTVGRNPSCSITIDNLYVSTRHCQIWAVLFDDASLPVVYVRDTSLNGVAVNGALLGANRVALASHGDKITIRRAVTFVLKVCGMDGNREVDNGIAIQPSMNWSVLPVVIGHGSFGSVYVGRASSHDLLTAADNDSTPQIRQQKEEEKEKHSKQQQHLKAASLCAVKICRKANRQNKFTEAAILSTLCHKNIIKIYEYHTHDNTTFIYQQLLYGGDLFSYINKSPLPESRSISIVKQILQAVNYLHSHNIVHRDLKLDNILLQFPGSHPKIVVADFGVATFYRCNSSDLMNEIVGTADFAAPEVGFVTGHSSYTHKCDLWSVGVTLYSLLSGRNICVDSFDLKEIVEKKKWKMLTKQLVVGTLQQNVNKRMSASDCLLLLEGCDDFDDVNS